MVAAAAAAAAAIGRSLRYSHSGLGLLKSSCSLFWFGEAKLA